MEGGDPPPIKGFNTALPVIEKALLAPSRGSELYSYEPVVFPGLGLSVHQHERSARSADALVTVCSVVQDKPIILACHQTVV